MEKRLSWRHTLLGDLEQSSGYAIKCCVDGVEKEMFDQRLEGQVHGHENRGRECFWARSPVYRGRVGTLFWEGVGSGEQSIQNQKIWQSRWRRIGFDRGGATSGIADLGNLARGWTETLSTPSKHLLAS